MNITCHKFAKHHIVDINDVWYIHIYNNRGANINIEYVGSCRRATMIMCNSMITYWASRDEEKRVVIEYNVGDEYEKVVASTPKGPLFHEEPGDELWRFKFIRCESGLKILND
jgi:hypothetical protein